MKENIQLFFEYSKASVYASASRDDYALYHYMECKNIGKKISDSCLDKALSYCGLGSVLYYMEEYELSLRSFLKAREIRENILELEHSDMGSMFNNIGCNMYMLERNNEALAHFKMAEAIFSS